MKKILLLAITFLTFVFTNAQEFSKTRILVKYNNTTNSKSENSVNKILAENNFKTSRSLSFKNENQKSNKSKETILFTFETEIDVLKIVSELKNTGLFEVVEPDYIAYGTGKKVDNTTFTTTPNDEFFSSARQWSLINDGSFATGTVTSTSGADIDMQSAWDITTGNPNITIAVLDTGLKMDHPEFAGRIWINPNETSDGADTDSNTFIDDINGWDFVNNDNDPTDNQGHGTNVTGIIAATGNNSIGYAGVDWKCKIMPLKVLNFENEGVYSNTIEGINYAVSKGVKIINISIAGVDESTLLEEAINNAYASGVIMIVSMGNKNTNIVRYPASYANTIAVGSTDTHDQRSNPFNSEDPATSGSNFGSHIDIVAPGSYILGLDFASDTQYNIFYSGTSQSAPLVAGICSLILDKKPNLTVEEIRAVLRDSADDMVGDPSEDVVGWDQYYGAGRVNAFKALQKVLSTENFNAEKFSFYPNPTSGILNMSEKLNDYNYTVYNILGKRVLKGTISDGKINLEAINKGIYTLKIQDNLEFITKKIIKN